MIVMGTPILLSVTAAFIMFGNLISELPSISGLRSVQDDVIRGASCGASGTVGIGEA